MRIGGALTLVAVGLILAYAVDFEVPGIDIPTLGTILFFIGLLGLAVTVGMEVMATRARRPPRVPRRPAPPARPVREREREREATYDPVVGPPPARRGTARLDDERTRVLDDEARTRRLP